MNRILKRYREVAPPGAVDELEDLALQVAGGRLQHIYSTDLGGGITEMLHGLAPLYQALGLDVRWDIILGTEEFFGISRALRRGLRGRPSDFTRAMAGEYLECTEANARRLYISADVVITHDVQAAALVRHRDPRSVWLWRCHFELNRSRPAFWRFLKKYVSMYDGALISHPNLARRMPVPAHVVAPSIDPFAESQREMGRKEVAATVRSLGIPMNRPILLHIGRGDESDDLPGLLNAVALARRQAKFTSVFLSVSSDFSRSSADAHRPQEGLYALALPSGAVREINALRHSAAVYAQGPGFEGFDLDALSAQWMGKPVIVSPACATVMGLSQGTGGFVAETPERVARAIALLVGDSSRARRAGAEGREHVRRRFLVTRHVRDYLRLILHLRGMRP